MRNISIPVVLAAVLCIILWQDFLYADSSGDGTVTVSTVEELQTAIDTASGETIIYLENGIYDVSSAGSINVHNPFITIRSLSGNRDSVVIQGAGMGAAGMGFGFYIDASDIVIADLTVRDVQNHAIFISPGNSPQNFLFQNIRCLDAGQQIFKASGWEAPKDNGIIELSVIEYTTTLDQGNYTNGIDLINSNNWIIRDNTIRNIKAAPGGGLAGPAILVWHGSSNTVIERNLIIDCDMGIFFGNSSLQGVNHTGGMIVNNFIKGYENTDAAIGIVRSTGATVLNNSIYSEGSLPWSIEVRYTESSNNLIMNNLMDSVILFRNGGSATLTTNMENVSSDVYVNAASGDLHLVSDTVEPVNAGTTTPDREYDIDLELISDGMPDIGADEYHSQTSVSYDEQQIPDIPPTFLVSPNPFRSSTTIWINLESDMNMKVTIFNTAGRLIRTISQEGCIDNDIFQVVWDGTDENGSYITPGIYLIRSQMGSTCQTIPVVFMR